MRWKDKTLADFMPIQMHDEGAVGGSDYGQFINILNRFNLIQQKNLQKMEDLRLEANNSLEKSRELTQALILERTELKNNLGRYEKAILDILDTVDNMMAILKETDNKEIEDFLRPFNKKLTIICDTLGWSIIPTQNMKADTDLHYALHTKPTPDPSQKDMIAGIIRQGYRCGDRVIRKAEIIVYI